MLTNARKVDVIAAIEEKTDPVRFHAKREIILTWAGIAVTLAATFMVVIELGDLFLQHVNNGRWALVAAHTLFIIIVAFLIYGGLVYQLTRLAYLRRRIRHCPMPRDQLETLYDNSAPQLAILVPSYKEDERVILQTLMSAALQEYPNRRVVLLIDDPCPPRSAADAAALAMACELPRRIQKLFTLPSQLFDSALAHFETRRARETLNITDEARHLISLYQEAATWFENQAQSYKVTDHVDALYVNKILLRQRDMHNSRASEIATAAQQVNGLCEARLSHEYRRLATLFKVELTSFQRKAYVNLSHEANKAMNLNSYIGLAGKSFRERMEVDGLYLDQVDAASADLHIPDADYFITLDADSLILSDYALRLVHLMEQPSNKRIAVAQTPYSAIPGAPGVLERVAGATTDIQYMIHQGFTAYNATYWVGANALLRKSALLDIAVTEEERGFTVTRYIQDRTVIEDTESSIDLVKHGWQLFNYPERLAYSATPPDFGSLLIQRRRWANGGLIILPKLLRYLARGPKRSGTLMEGFMRVHYLSSIAVVNVGLLIVLAIPFAGNIESLWLPVTAAPYFALYARDLVLMGYRGSDIFRVYALNLLLIPINLGGVLKSLQQVWTKEKIPFGRTPKVQGRTAASPLYIIATYLLLLYWLIGTAVDFSAAHWGHGLFALTNAFFLLYAMLYFIGLKESKEDLIAGIHARRAATTANSAMTPKLPVPAISMEAENGEKCQRTRLRRAV